MTPTTPTPHISAQRDEIAPFMLMCGDPLRAKYIADNYLENAKCVNEIRGMYCYTGEHGGKRLSVMGHGVGMPSIGLYSHELFNFYGVETIVRLGTAGAMRPEVPLRGLVIAQGASTDSSWFRQYGLPGNYSAIADFGLCEKAAAWCREKGIPVYIGGVLSADAYYDAEEGVIARWARMGIAAVEMEGAALYANAAYAGKRALCVLTVSNSLLTGEETDPDERRTSFTNMIELGLSLV